MIPGPDIIISCPHCGALARLRTCEQIEPVGAVSWTDGYQEIPGMPHQPNIARCQSCRALYWVALAEQAGFLLPGEEAVGEKAGWGELPEIAQAEEEDYFEALEGNLAMTRDQELELRVHAWWRGGDRHRGCEKGGRFPIEDRAVGNLKRIIELTAEGDHEMVLFRAEALRQLGRFDDAAEALCGLCSDYALARERQLGLIREKSRDLGVLFA